MSAAVGDVRGLWHRKIYRRGTQPPDLSSDVHWLQGPRFFADVRQPVERMAFSSVSCLRDLESHHLTWLARQDAFAGVLQLEGNLAWWQRVVDLQPQGPFEDRARLEQRGDVLDEFGTEADYFERWERHPCVPQPCWGMHLRREADSREGFLVRVGDRLMFARARAIPLPPGPRLPELLSGIPALARQQDLLDVEVSLGSVAADASRWLIERSTLPFKQQKLWSIERVAASARGVAAPMADDVIELGDLDAHGARIVSQWRIEATDADDAAYEFAARSHEFRGSK